jgi:hypothetical protein
MFTITTPTRSLEDLERIRAVREATQLIRLPGDPPAAPAPRRSATPPRPTSAPPRPPAATPTPAAQAYAAGAAQARSDALACIAICAEFGRPDLVHQVVGLDPAQARAFLINAMWDDAFARARATPSWMPR